MINYSYFLFNNEFFSTFQFQWFLCFSAVFDNSLVFLKCCGQAVDVVLCGRSGLVGMGNFIRHCLFHCVCLFVCVGGGR